MTALRVAACRVAVRVPVANAFTSLRLFSTTKAMTVKQPHVVVVGGAYAGLAALNSLISLSNGHGHPAGKKRPAAPAGSAHAMSGPPRGPPLEAPDVSRALRIKPRYTLLDVRDGFYHSVGAPLGQISPSHGREFWVKYDEIMRTKYASDPVDFVQGSAFALDTASKTLRYRPTGKSVDQTLSYDFLVVASGMSREWPILPRSLDYDTYVSDTESFENELKPCSRIVLVGGGACGIEMSAEMKVHFPEKEIILIHSRSDLLSREPLSDEFKAIALQLLREQGVDVRLNTRLLNESASGSKRMLELSTGETLECDKVVYTAVQQGPNTGFVPEQALDEQGYVKVRDTFQFAATVPNADAHYAVGDVARWTGIKRSGPAMAQGKLAATNIVTSLIALEDGKAIEDAELVSAPPSRPTMTLAIGEQAIGMRAGLRYGREVKDRAFGTGLGIDGTLENLGLRPRRRKEVAGEDEASMPSLRPSLAATASI
ncbi:uncharacterized protein PV09_08095 [Verruconis gallopava]|uniref:FAD/NAD(P)-binding domain-containing protein n=1 Tax=Verruconis gallopava TaxID=253628 RepID=A0A0D1XDV6_9PEZI|nr:uncharacterized protein PV09_08095 [Verruconis gallopava]KIW00386.1 hypothetical protein PV09_08095 [Verruconis gallopava]